MCTVLLGVAGMYGNESFRIAITIIKGFRSRGNGILSPLIATVLANATRSTSGFNQTVANSWRSTMQVYT